MNSALEGQNRALSVLFVKNNNRQRESIQLMLESEYDLINVNTYDLALEKAIANVPDIILINAEFPCLKSVELCRSLKNNLQTNHVPVVLLESKQLFDYKHKCLEVGADAYLGKNESLTIIKLQIENLLQNRRLVRFHYQNEPPFQEELNNYSLDQLFILRVQDSVSKHYSDADYNVSMLVNDLCISRSNLYTRLKSLTGLTTSAYIRLFRLKKGAELLKTGHLNVSQVAYSIGLNDPKYFSKSFKKLYGLTPTEYQRRVDGLVDDKQSFFLTSYNSPKTPA
ncbi:helix-turn-helix domain-containing protein [Carboxylicivirga sp. RSCT41]|uniref:helix-turn-helix domain-containing protein n=1 Tax=Carboxylicivirga agarovorans TaxID=3417570 RepID=UPI003D3483BD